MTRHNRSNRFLPEHVTRFKDRHGKWRYRFRRKGFPSGYFKATFGTDEFRAEYAVFMDPRAPKRAAEADAIARFRSGTIGELRHRYFALPERLGPTETTQNKVRAVLERGFFNGRESWPLAGIHFEHIDVLIAARRKKALDENGKVTGGIEAAKKLRKELVRLFDFAEAANLITASPMKHVASVKVAPEERSAGFYSWTEDDIAQYRSFWRLGTKQRLAMELMLWTDQRKVDSIHLGRQHVKDGKFHLRQTKTGKSLILPIAPPLQIAIDAMPLNDAFCYLVTEWGKPFSVKGFGNWMRDMCDRAGLPKCTAHGLRKATMRRMAELETPNASMKAVSGHSKDDEVARYVAAANQARLAEAAIDKLVQWEMSNLDPRLEKSA
jgi:integrase